VCVSSEERRVVKKGAVRKEVCREVAGSKREVPGGGQGQGGSGLMSTGV
jgi:hypothetical protein